MSDDTASVFFLLLMLSVFALGYLAGETDWLAPDAKVSYESRDCYFALDTDSCFCVGPNRAAFVAPKTYCPPVEEE